MKLPEPIGYYNPESGMLTSNAAMKGVLDIEWLNVYTEAQLREALASHEAVMRQALELLGPQAPECCGCAAEWNEAIKSLEDALGT